MFSRRKKTIQREETTSGSKRTLTTPTLVKTCACEGDETEEKGGGEEVRDKNNHIYFVVRRLGRVFENRRMV